VRRCWPWAILCIAAAAMFWSWYSGGVVADLLSPQTSADDKVAALKQYFESCGVWAPLAYVVFVTIEVVVAPLPGIMLYAPGGLIFGAFWGGTLAVIGNTLGAGLSCLLMRSLGAGLATRLNDSQAIERLQTELESRGGMWIFLLRVNPLTSSDLVSWAAGLTRIRTVTVMLATGCGMAPLCYLQSWLSDTLFNRFPWLIVPLLVLSVLYVACVVVVMRRLVAGDSVNSELSAEPAVTSGDSA
jgi:uncharacterized membrane protein YdjX (TVP38/TMEM64 family)